MEVDWFEFKMRIWFERQLENCRSLEKIYIEDAVLDAQLKSFHAMWLWTSGFKRAEIVLSPQWDILDLSKVHSSSTIGQLMSYGLIVQWDMIMPAWQGMRNDSAITAQAERN